MGSQSENNVWCGVEIENLISIYHIDTQKQSIKIDDWDKSIKKFKFKKIFGNCKKEIPPFDDPKDKTGIIHFRIKENYQYVIKKVNSNVIKFSKSNDKAVKWQPIGDESILFSISGFLGSAKIEVNETVICFEVVPTKIDFDEDFRLMTNELSEMFSQLLLEWNTPTYLSFKDSDDKKFKTLYEQFITIKHLLESEKLNSYLQIILRNPHQKLVDESKWEPSFASNIPNFIKNPIKNGRDWNTKTKIPNEIYSTKRKISIDTPPNQFVKYFLQYSLSICNEILELIDKKGSNEIIKTEVIQICQQLEAISTFPFFKEISLLHKIPFDNQTLQKRTGYREILRAWIGTQLAKIINWEDRKDTIDADVRNVAKLYEFWLFFKLEEIIRKIEGVKNNKNTSFKPSEEGLLSISLKEGNDSIFEFDFKNSSGDFKISLYYNKTFSSNKRTRNKAISGSYSRHFRPDYTIVFYQGVDEQEAIELGTIAYLHFDAKYRLDSEFEKMFKEEEKTEPSEEENILLQKELDEEETDVKVNKTYKRGDLYKMHTYNDAILKTVGSYILYPGDICEGDKNKKYFTAYHEILPGVGAFAIKPIETEIGSNDHLRQFIKDCFEIQSNKFSQLYQIQSDLHNVIKNKSPFENNFEIKSDNIIEYFYPEEEKKSPNELNIIIGHVKDSSSLDLMVKNNKFWWHAINNKGIALKIKMDVFRGEYVLLKVKNRLTGFYGKISCIKLVKAGDKLFPNRKKEFNADFYYLIEIEEFKENESLKNLVNLKFADKIPYPMKWSELYSKI